MRGGGAVKGGKTNAKGNGIMIKFLIGGSPCTHWSIAQSKNRETTAEGIGWELFKNYLIAKEKFRPDFFLYENNKSAAQPIKNQIAAELQTPLQYINSALVSAQNRQRFYAHNFGDVPPPVDRGILLQDILEFNAIAHKEKAYTLRASGGNKQGQYNLIRHIETGGQFGYMGVAEPVNAYARRIVGRKINEHGRRDDYNPNLQTLQRFEINQDPNKTNCLTTVEKDNMIAAPIEAVDYKPLDNCNVVSTEQGLRCVYKETGLNAQGYHVQLPDTKMRALLAGQCKEKVIVPYLPNSNAQPIYKVKHGLITIKGKQYPIKLPDGLYIIRNLTVTECCRLQTMPDDYCRAVSKSQAYKGLGNGWTAEVIIHLLSYALKGIPKNEPITVLSMYDGIGTGRYCFDKLGYKNIIYHAYEIDKFAMQISESNYSNIQQCGDAFQVRADDWFLSSPDKPKQAPPIIQTPRIYERNNDNQLGWVI